MRKKPKNIYTQLFHLRTMKNMSQRALSKASGVSSKTIVDIESGRSWPNTDTVAKLAKGLGITPPELFTQDTECADDTEEESVA